MDLIVISELYIRYDVQDICLYHDGDRVRRCHSSAKGHNQCKPHQLSEFRIIFSLGSLIGISWEVGFARISDKHMSNNIGLHFVNGGECADGTATPYEEFQTENFRQRPGRLYC